MTGENPARNRRKHNKEVADLEPTDKPADLPEGLKVLYKHLHPFIQEHLNHWVRTQGDPAERKAWLEESKRPLLARKSSDLDRILEMLELIDRYMTVTVGGNTPLQWTNSNMGRTLAALIEELKTIQGGNWSGILQPDKSKRGNQIPKDRKLTRADLSIRQEAVFAVPYFESACGSRSKAQTEIAEALQALGIKASRSSLTNWEKSLSSQNDTVGILHSRFYSELPEDLKVPVNIKPEDKSRLVDVMKRIYRAWAGDQQNNELSKKSAKDSGQ